MTTIAYKDGVIAYDSQATSGDVIVDHNCEKMFERSGVKFFICGSVPDMEQMIDMYFSEEKAKPSECNAFVVDKGELYLIGADSQGFWKQSMNKAVPRAIGSGSPYAHAAMDMGADAKTAVKIAINRDVYSGGKIKTYKLKP